MAASEKKEQNREQSLRIARQKIRRLVNSNAGQWTEPSGSIAKSKMLTLTFRENEKDIKKANYEFEKFIKRMNYYYRINIKYLAVVEFQKRGAIHYHLILFNMPFIDDLKALESIWGNGKINIKALKNVDNIGAYLCKYLTKDTAERLKEKKCFFYSRGLKKEEVIKDEKKINLLQTGLRAPKFEATFKNEHIGYINYKQYNLNRQ